MSACAHPALDAAVRAKAKIRQARIPFVVPDLEELPERLATVLDAIYATFAEGWSDPAGTDARQRNRAEEGLRLGRVLASLLPDQAEALGLLAGLTGETRLADRPRQ